MSGNLIIATSSNYDIQTNVIWPWNEISENFFYIWNIEMQKYLTLLENLAINLPTMLQTLIFRIIVVVVYTLKVTLKQRVNKMQDVVLIDLPTKFIIEF